MAQYFDRPHQKKKKEILAGHRQLPKENLFTYFIIICFCESKAAGSIELGIILSDPKHKVLTCSLQAGGGCTSAQGAAVPSGFCKTVFFDNTFGSLLSSEIFFCPL
jgi:hypothetical protein